MLVENVVVNLSKYHLSMHEISVLNKGLGFVPSLFKPSRMEVANDVLRFERRLQLHYFFSSKKDNPDPDCFKKHFESNPNWWPHSLNSHITDFCTKIKYLLLDTLTNKGFSNLTKKEMIALRSLKDNREIVIKKSDKGGGIAVLDSTEYLSKVQIMLNDLNVYTPTSVDDTIEVKLKADELIYRAYDEGNLNIKQVAFLTDFTPRCPLFHGLPKLHKKGWPLRPIVSQINGPTCRINAYVDKLLTVAEKCIPFLLQDTTAFLQILARHKECPPGTFLVTLDVTSLYTNIPHDEGTDWVCDFYCETLPQWQLFDIGIQPVDRDLLKDLILFILNNCTFDFNHTLYRQNFGTTMGAKFSVKFANIYMHMWFRKFLSSYSYYKPTFLARLIDDCFFIWPRSEIELQEFLLYLNSCHPTIKFEWQFSSERVTFLDTITYVSNGTLQTTIYNKPTDKKQYLFFTSCHPSHVTRSIPYSQAIRYRRIIGDDSLLVSELANLKAKFINRGYPSSLLDAQIDKCRTVDRSNTLLYKTAREKRANFHKFLKGRSFLPLIVTYHGGLNSAFFKKTFHDLWTTFSKVDSSIESCFLDERPQIVYKRGKTIGNVVTSTRFRTAFDQTDCENIEILASLLHENDTRCSFAVSKCKKPRCLCCDHIMVGSHFYDSSSSRIYRIDRNYNCGSSNLIYLIKCLRCDVLYVGQTTRYFRERLNNHRSDIRLNKLTAVGKHFNEPLHTVNDLKIMPIHDVSRLSVDQRLMVENRFMTLLNTKYPYGLNCYPLAGKGLG